MKREINEALKEALTTGDEVRISTLRLVLACLNDREIALRAEDGVDTELPEQEAIALLERMVDQRAASASAYEQAAHMELAEREREEAEVIAEFLPRKLSEEEVTSAVDKAIRDTRAGSIRDMGKVMETLKRRYRGQMDFAAASARVKSALA